MKVILTQDVRGQGKRGQMIEVSDGYARNFLLPRKLAQEATADNVNTMKMNDKAAQERQAKERAEALEIRNRMKDMTVVVTAKGGGAGRLFGSITNVEIADALAKLIAPPIILPIGAIMSFIGGPVFLILLFRGRNSNG